MPAPCSEQGEETPSCNSGLARFLRVTDNLPPCSRKCRVIIRMDFGNGQENRNTGNNSSTKQTKEHEKFTFHLLPRDSSCSSWMICYLLRSFWIASHMERWVSSRSSRKPNEPARTRAVSSAFGSPPRKC